MVESLGTIEDKDAFDEELHETATDVSKTLAIAVEILTDLMTFNRIESGAVMIWGD